MSEKDAVKIGEMLLQSFADVEVKLDGDCSSVKARGHTRYAQYPEHGRKINEE